MTSKKTKEAQRRSKERGGATMSEEMWNKHVHGIEPPTEEERKAASDLEQRWPTMTIEEKLEARPMDAGTLSDSGVYLDFGDFKGVFEKWIWDGFSGQSVIILFKDFERFKSEKECRNFIFEKMQLPVDPKTTMKISGKYFFINFNVTGKE